MLIEVKEEDWRNHLQKLNDIYFYPPSENCPIASALKRIFGVSYAQVTYNTIRVGQFPENLMFVVPTSKIVHDWIMYYDLAPMNHFKPFEFELDLPSDTPIN